MNAPNKTTQLPPELQQTAYNLNEEFASRYLGVHVETIRGWRKQGKGPQFRKIGGRAVRYSLRDLLAFVDAQPIGGGERRSA